MAFEYKVVPAPETGVKRRGLRKPADRIAAAMAETIAAQATHGWEYVRADVIPVTEGGGWLSRPREVQRALLVFRRSRPGARQEQAQAQREEAPLFAAREEAQPAPAPREPARAAAPEPAVEEPPRYPDYADYREPEEPRPELRPEVRPEPRPEPRPAPRAEERPEPRGEELFAPRRAPVPDTVYERPTPRPEPGFGALRPERPRPSTGAYEGSRRPEPRPDPTRRDRVEEPEAWREEETEPPMRADPEAPRFRSPYRDTDRSRGAPRREDGVAAEPEALRDGEEPKRSPDDDLSDIRSALRRLER